MENCLFIYGELSVYLWRIVCLSMDFLLCTTLKKSIVYIIIDSEVIKWLMN